MTLINILDNGFDTYPYKDFKAAVQCLKELKEIEIEEKHYERVANTLKIMLLNKTYLKKETIEKLDNLLNYVRREDKENISFT